ncbi:urate hydroxylase PuuD [Aestuariibacter halophilus]|uniref:Urate hydroxylase PuuD n=1 Tax=Fluctibacter halophilus TaxID=226011 RepID=A0ABS8G5A2_9ALTE|nr:urate hydroxylase PuuD [Aestuariibacter halophilus]MCC2615740.1 urate hydroxylase PuuD [Aestuariibacter halophilus]
MMWQEWIALCLRWFHVIAGIAWIGASFYFIWLDNNLREPPQWKKDRGIKGDLWAIHGGGFYEVGKYAYGPQTMPTTLHWFKWEAYATWLSGTALLVLIYYIGASAYLIDPAVMDLTPAQAVLRGVGLILAGFLVYELACRSELANRPTLFAVLLVVLMSVATVLATQWFSGRGAYIHVGALMGTIMAANVFVKIIPAQRQLVAAVAEKRPIDPVWGEQAKLRSVHNNYLTLPLLFTMISNHYPMTYQHAHSAALLIAIMLTAAWIRHYFNLRHTGQHRPAILVSGGVALVLIALWAQWPEEQAVSEPNSLSKQPAAEVTVPEDVMAVMANHCQQCHSKSPTDEMFVIAPMGVVLDTPQDVSRLAGRVYQRTVVSKDMPFMNKSAITDAERDVIKRWFERL